MENASKALIIAGAILLSILIIALGMTVYNSSSSVTGSIGMDAQEISAFNSKFLSYQGKQKGPQVTALLNYIQTNNNDYGDRKISVSFLSTTDDPTKPTGYSSTVAKYLQGGLDSTINAIRDDIKPNTTYKVEFGYNTEGLIDDCGIHINQ